MAKVTTLAYPVGLDEQESGGFLVSFPDIPEALTEGATVREALAEAEDCLIAALGGGASLTLPGPALLSGRYPKAARTERP